MYKFNRKNQDGKSAASQIYAGSRVIGTVRNGTFFKSIAANHYLKKPPAIAFSVDSLNQAERMGAVRVEVKDRDNGTVYRATIQHIREKGFPLQRAGFEPQIALTLDGWTNQRKVTPAQLPLFGGV